MKPTPGLFAPSEAVLRAAARAKARLGGRAYVGVHVRRGDKLAMMPGLAGATSGEAVARSVAAAAPPGVAVCYLATNEEAVDYAGPLRAQGFQCYGAAELFPELRAGGDNYLLFAAEMLLVDEAAACICTFSDSPPWFFSQERREAHHLLDRSMHDYALGFSAMRCGRSEAACPVALGQVIPEAAYDALLEAGADGHSYLAVRGLSRLAPVGPEPAARTRYRLQLASGTGPGAPRPPPQEMSHEGQGIYTATVAAGAGGVAGFEILVEGAGGELWGSLYPDVVGRWPVERLAVQGPGARPSDEHLWWLDPGHLGAHEVRLDAVGRRSLTVRPLP